MALAGRAGDGGARERMRVLTVNAGSSSLKLALVEDGLVHRAIELDAPDARSDPDELGRALHGGLAGADAVGHRIVHGGERFTEAVRIDPRVRKALGALSDLAPLHQPKSLAALDAVGAALPELPAVACFDTAFHASMPAGASTYALPAPWRERWGLRRYGFHGLSHAWVARRTGELLGTPAAEMRIVSCHLGAGGSLCAIRGARSLDTTMGFTPLEGLVMATRSGSVDPGLLLWLAEHGGLPLHEIAEALEHRSGLLGLAGTADMRTVIDRAGEEDDRAQLALEVYVHRLCGEIARMVAALGGLDVLVFTGGVGERSAELRARAASRLGFLGIALDGACNEEAEPDVEIGAAGAPVRALVLAAHEDLEIASQTGALIEAGG